MCEDGSAYEADVVLVGIGVGPQDDLAQAAGLDCMNGIVVDQHCRTSDPNIYAAGDCASHPSIHYGRRVRLESVDNAFEQASSVALNMLGTPTPHDKVPWFWSDQYDLKMIIVGLSQGYDEAITRGSPESPQFQCVLPARGRAHCRRHRELPQRSDGRAQTRCRPRPPRPLEAYGTQHPLKDCL